MKRILSLVMCILVVLCSTVLSYAVDFDDTYCDLEFKGEKLWMSDLNPNSPSGHSYDSENGIYQYDWVHQIWDSEHEQLYVQEKYSMTVDMKTLFKAEGEMLDSMSYQINVANYSDDKLLSQYTSVDDIATPEGYNRMDIKVSGYDAVYIYTESKTEGDGNGIVSQANNHGNIYVPIVDAPNERGGINTLKIECVIKGESFALFDSMIGEFMGYIQALPCTITIDRQEKVFKKGALTGASTNADSGNNATEDSANSDNSSDKNGSLPIIPIIGVAVVAGGAAVVIKSKGSKKASTTKKPVETAKPTKTAEEIKHEKYKEKLKEKYGVEDEKELKKEIMKTQIHNEKLGYIAQADMAYTDAALDTAEKSKKVADVSADVIAELGGAKGKVFKNIYTGLTETAEAAGEIISGRDAAEALTEAAVDSSIGVIQNQADGFRQKFVANTFGSGARDFADTYLETGGDLVKAIDAADDAVKSEALDTVIDVGTDGLVDKAMGKAALDAGKEAVEEGLKAGVNASKTFSQDLIKDSIKD